MQKLLAKNLYIGNVKIIDNDKIVPVVVYKKDNRYYDMNNVFSKIDLNSLKTVYYTETPTYNSFHGVTEKIEKNSLKNYYNDGREIFDIYELNTELKENKPKQKVK